MTFNEKKNQVTYLAGRSNGEGREDQGLWLSDKADLSEQIQV